MQILVDGYNVLFAQRRELGRSLGPTQLERPRQQLLTLLNRYQSLGRDRLTIVFDALGQPAGLGSRPPFGGLNVLFPRGGTADEVIMGMILKEPDASQLLVVSADNEIARAAKKAGAATATADAFLKLVREALTGANKSTDLEPRMKYDKPPQSEVDYWLKQFGDDEAEDE